MKLSTIPIAVLVFGLIVVGAVTIFNASNPEEYGISADATSGFSTYNRVDELYNRTDIIYNQVKGSESGSGISNFLVSLSSMWSTIQLFFDLFDFGISSSTDVQEQLGIPPLARYAFLGIILVGLIVLIISAAIRWRLNEA